MNRSKPNEYSTCNDDRLRILLAIDEDSQQYRQTLNHVDHCEHCQSRLEQIAASEIAWQEAQAMLTSSDCSLKEDAKRRPQQSPWNQRATAWTDSMVKQLLSAPSHPEMLGRIGRYEVERLIGSGGMGIVFKAFDTELNRPVAVKVLAPHLAGSGAARQRFAREARAAAAVVHEHVVAIHNVETEGASPFLVMQFVAGESLQQRLDREGPLELCEVLRIATQTASGLAAAHAQGLVHRDVKPPNILLEQGIERTLLTDFGLARTNDDASLTHTGYHPGTPQYMSPEQARGDSVDARSDLFSLGSVIYTMCTGHSPFRAETTYGILRRITDNAPRSMREVNSKVPEWLDRIVFKLLAKSPDDRYASAEEVRSVLEQCLAHLQQPTSVSLPNSVRRSSWESSSLLKPIAIALGAALFIAAIFAATVNREPKVVGQPRNDASPLVPDEGPTDPFNDLNAETSWRASTNEINRYNEELLQFQERQMNLWQTRRE